MKKILKAVCCTAVAMLTLLAAGWIDRTFPHRIEVDVDTIRHTPGRKVMLTLDVPRLEKALETRIAPGTIKICSVSKNGGETALPFSCDGIDEVDNKMRISFTMPDGKVYLYYGGSGNAPQCGYPDAFNGTSLDAAKYRSDGFMTVSRIDGALKFKQKKLTKKSEVSVCHIPS